MFAATGFNQGLRSKSLLTAFSSALGIELICFQQILCVNFKMLNSCKLLSEEVDICSNLGSVQVINDLFVKRCSFIVTEALTVCDMALSCN